MNRLLTIVFLTVIACAGCFGQETEAANGINLTGTSVPANAQRILSPHVPTEIEQALDKVVSESNGKLRRGETEVLLWSGSALKKSGPQAVVGRLTESLKGANWKYEVLGTENDVTLFSLLKDGTSPRVMVGLFVEADGTLLFALTEMRAGESKQTTSSSPDYAGTSGVVDCSFTTPKGWSRSDAGGKIVLNKDDGNGKIEFLPTMTSSGDVESDARKLIWQIYRGYDAWYSNGFEADWGIFEKGRTAQGLDYFRVYRYAKKTTDPNDSNAESRFDAVLLLVKLGSNVAVIAGRQPFQSDYMRDSTIDAIDWILYDINFKGVAEVYDLKKDFLGSWSAAGGSAALAYTFNANGTFNKGGAIGFRTSHDKDRDKLTVSSYGMTDSYSLSGNLLTQKYKSTGEVVKYKVRIYQTKYNKDPWQQKMGFMPTVNPDGGTIVFRK